MKLRTSTWIYLLVILSILISSINSQEIQSESQSTDREQVPYWRQFRDSYIATKSDCLDSEVVKTHRTECSGEADFQDMSFVLYNHNPIDYREVFFRYDLKQNVTRFVFRNFDIQVIPEEIAALQDQQYYCSTNKIQQLLEKTFKKFDFQPIYDQITESNLINPSEQIIFSGIAYGGAVARYVAGFVQQQFQHLNVVVHSFCEPTIFLDQDFIDQYPQKEVKSYFRMISEVDQRSEPIQSCPSKSLLPLNAIQVMYFTELNLEMNKKNQFLFPPVNFIDFKKQFQFPSPK